MKWRAMLRDWRGFFATFRLRCPTCGGFYYLPSEMAGDWYECRCEKHTTCEGGTLRWK